MKNNIYITKTPKEGERLDSLLNHKNVKIERIISSDKITDKEYVQEQDEWVILLKGQATLNVAGDLLSLSEGDYLFIPAGQKHRVLKTESSTVWLAVHIF